MALYLGDNKYNITTVSGIVPPTTAQVGEALVVETTDAENRPITWDTKNIFDLVYPVGAIYLSVSDISPATLFGGTWEQIEDRFLLGAGSAYMAGSTGGAASVALSTAQVPNVIGDITMHSGGTATNISNVSGCFSAQITNQNSYRNGGTVGDTAKSIGIIHFDNGGQGQAHNNMPPYLTVYMWKRIE